MAELLVNLRHVSDDTWLPGQVIVVMPDGHKWGSEEKPPKFFIMQLPGVHPDKVRKLLDAEYNDTAEGGKAAHDLPRSWKILLERIPGAMLQTALKEGRVKLSAEDWDQLVELDCIRNESHYRRYGTEECMRDSAKDLGIAIDRKG